jgi:hypothetical protein
MENWSYEKFKQAVWLLWIVKKVGGGIKEKYADCLVFF